MTGEVATYASSQHGRRQFCPRCGTSLFYRNEAVTPGLVDVASATLDDAEASAGPIEQINVADRVGWMKRAHMLPEHERFPPNARSHHQGRRRRRSWRGSGGRSSTTHS